MSNNRQCSVNDCGKPVFAKRLCRAHYMRMWRHGDVLANNPVRKRSGTGEALAFFKAVVLPYDGDDCLIWPFGRRTDGYARLRLDGHRTYVHRLACEHVHGPAPTDKHQTAHTCGKAACCNPQHLRWATSKENNADKIIHGTTNRGERCGSSKLTEADVREIRQMSSTHREISEKFGVSRSTIRDIKAGATWRKQGVTHG